MTTKHAIIACVTLTTFLSGCCGPRTVASFECPPRPELVGLAPSEILTTDDTVLQKIDHNTLEVRRYVLKCEAREAIANDDR